MKLGSLALLLIAVAAGLWLFRDSSTNAFHGFSRESPAPIDRAKAAADKSNARAAETDAAQTEADAAAPAAGVTENMTPAQVKALLGPPSDSTSETTDAGVRRETWTYAQTGKTVVFENGIAVSIR
ncbi:MAG: hypothetical protein ABI682_15490 [Acidobacteriota bacterium]